MKKWVALLFVCLFANSFSQTNVSPQFSELKGMKDKQVKNNLLPVEILNLYPLAIGNKWVNLIMTVVNPNVYYDVTLTEVLSDSIAPNDKLYYHLKEGNNHYLDRVDSLDGKVYRYYENPILPENEYFVADLLGEVGDSVQSFNPSYPTYYSYTKIIRVATFNNWGLTKQRKVYQQVTPGLQGRIFSFTEDIGPDSLLSAYIGASAYVIKTLKGCVINGIVYGDTTLTSIENGETPIVNEFKLEQNYPNPFNPSTVISWQSPVSNWQTLKVFDILGNEVATLVDEFKPAGKYEVEFNSHSDEGQNLSSGIYFYQLVIKASEINSQEGQAEQVMIQTRKMILLK